MSQENLVPSTEQNITWAIGIKHNFKRNCCRPPLKEGMGEAKGLFTRRWGTPGN